MSGKPTRLTELDISEAADLLRRRKISPVELTTACLDRIQQLNPVLNAFITVTSEMAMAQAREAENQIQHGEWRGALHGVPIGLKDLIDTAGVKTTCASAVFASRIPTEDAEVVQRLRHAGAVLIGKQNMHEFAYGGTSVPSHYGPVRNPWDIKRIAGGSSGGSGAAVAAGLCFGAIGSDTGGSIREPSAFCGLVGMKPTFGRVSTRGVVPLSWSLDHLGPMCRSVTDAALLLEAIAGYDPAEATSVDRPTERYSRALSAKTNMLRVGLVRRPFFESLDPEIESAVNHAIEEIRKHSATVREVELPMAPPGNVVGPEAYAFHRPYFAKTPELYQPWTRERLNQVKDIPATAYVEARRELDRARRSVNTVFSLVDVLVTPTTPVLPLTVDEVAAMAAPPPQGELWLRNTRPFNAYGLPTISIPCGFSRTGLPIGLQITGPHFAEGKVLAFAHELEQRMNLRKRTPVL